MSDVSDIDRALDLYSFLAAGGSHEEFAFTVMPGAPSSKSRPKFANGKVYSTGDSARAEAITARHLLRLRPDGPMEGNVALGCIFYRPNSNRIDVDNLLKHVCDAANGVLWIDDSQVTAIMGMIELDAGNPRTVIVIGLHSSSLVRGSGLVRACAKCDKPFTIVGSSQELKRYCSVRCAATSRPKKHGTCVDCGKHLHRPTSKRCRPCHFKAGSPTTSTPVAIPVS